MDLKWEFTVGRRELKGVFYISEEKKRRNEGKKYHCSVCEEEITVTPGYTFDHHGWKCPVVNCGAYLIRQMEGHGRTDVLYICRECYKQSEFEDHLAIERRLRIQRP